MALNVQPSALLREIHEAEAFRHEHMKRMPSQVDAYVGPAYRGKSTSEPETPENHYHYWLSLVVPKLTHDNPRVLVSTRRHGAQREVATAIEQGLNRWCKDVDLRGALARGPAVDMQFSWGVMCVRHTPSPRAKEIEGVGGPGAKGQPFVPRVDRLSQHWYFEDPVALSRDQLRFQGHMFVRDREDLIEEAKENPKLGWNLEMLTDMGSDHNGDSPGLDALNRPDQVGVRRGEVVGYEVWVPEYELDESPGRKKGFNGTIFTLAYSNQQGEDNPTASVDKIETQQYLRKPRPFYGPPSGPYTVFGVYTVPDDPTFLSPLAVVDEQIKDLNRHADAMSRSASRYKRMVLVDSKDSKLAETIKNGEHDYVIPIPGAVEQNGVWNLEIGGITEQMLGYNSVARDRLDRNSGIHEAKRGSSSGGTATEAAIADEAAETRLGFIESQFLYGVKQLLQKVGWYLYHDNRVAFPLPEEAGEAAGLQPHVVTENGIQRIIPPEPWFYGGHEDGDEDESEFTFEDLELDIEPYSMSRINQAGYQARTMQASQVVMQMAPLMVQFPFIRWQQMLDGIGNSLNVPDMGELVDVDLAMKYASMMMQGGPTAEQGGDKTKPGLVKFGEGNTRQFVPRTYAGPAAPEQRAGGNADAPGMNQAQGA